MYGRVIVSYLIRYTARFSLPPHVVELLDFGGQEDAVVNADLIHCFIAKSSGTTGASRGNAKVMGGIRIGGGAVGKTPVRESDGIFIRIDPGAKGHRTIPGHHDMLPGADG